MEHSLHVVNSLTGEKEAFQPLNPPFVGMYVCGPTVYSYVHLGNCRTFLTFDLIYRYLNHLGYKVRYVRNITDAGHLTDDADQGEDKIAKKARMEQLEPMQIVQQYTLNFHEVLRLLNMISPDIEPTATGHIIEQINATQALLDKGLAYEVNGSVYFDVKKYNEETNNAYGVLSGRVVDELQAGSRDLDGQEEKRDPVDFALWKKAAPEHIMRWNSPWGEGFPGWHLECSVMSSKYLGEQFDIHGGGMDLKFPHHECEIAQNHGLNGVAPVKYWLHGNMLTLNGKRMSKSTGNTVDPLDLFSGENDVLTKAYSPAVFRFFVLQAHYRSTLDISDDALQAAEKGLERLMAAIGKLGTLPTSDSSTVDVAAISKACHDAMDDDFSSPMAIAALFEGVKAINSISDGKQSITEQDRAQLELLYRTFAFDVFGLEEGSESAGGDDRTGELIELLLQYRTEAKANKNFELSDKIRDDLAQMKIIIQDTKDGATWEYEK